MPRDNLQRPDRPGFSPEFPVNPLELSLPIGSPNTAARESTQGTRRVKQPFEKSLSVIGGQHFAGEGLLAGETANN